MARNRMRMNVSLLEDIEDNYNRLDIKNAMSKITVPVLIIHGKEDQAVDAGEAQTLFDLSDKKLSRLVILENTGHTFGAVHPFEGTTGALEKVIEEITQFTKLL
ncbi:MAG: alpha/beta hydrolase [Bacteroidetes bacterium]|nr:alpha/beta hydrolase [Bacteroidota bacterium]